LCFGIALRVEHQHSVSGTTMLSALAVVRLATRRPLRLAALPGQPPPWSGPGGSHEEIAERQISAGSSRFLWTTSLEFGSVTHATFARYRRSSDGG
jgi:hypothetical protein